MDMDGFHPRPHPRANPNFDIFITSINCNIAPSSRLELCLDFKTQYNVNLKAAVILPDFWWSIRNARLQC